MLATAAQEDFHEFIDDEQYEGQAEAEQPLVAVQRGQAQTSLQEAKFSRQVDEQQGQTIEQQLVSIMQDIPVERCQGFTVAADTIDDNEE